MRRLAPRLLLTALVLFSQGANAQSADTIRAVVYEFLRGQSAGLPGEVHIEVTPPQAQPPLPACDRIEPWLPAGARAWGRIRVGVRCVGQANWSLYVSAQVRVIGRYLVSARALRPGEILTAADLAEQQGDLTEMGRQLLTDPTQAIGSQMRFAVAQGQPMRASMMAQPQVIQSGRPVAVIVQGNGFRVANSGVALSNARAGDGVRVRLPSGKVVHGVATENGEVVLSP